MTFCMSILRAKSDDYHVLKFFLKPSLIVFRFSEYFFQLKSVCLKISIMSYFKKITHKISQTQLLILQMIPLFKIHLFNKNLMKKMQKINDEKQRNFVPKHSLKVKL